MNEPTFWMDDDEPWFRHFCHDEPIAMRIPLAPERWHLDQSDPMTVNPSIHCTSCGLHGFIRDGAWINAWLIMESDT